MVTTEFPDSSEAEDRILAAALKVFSQKGKDGARTQEIADEAGVNKAMLHYYFRSKDRLYEEVFAFVFRRAMTSFGAAMQEADRFEVVLRTFIYGYIEFVRSNLPVVRLMVNELLAGGPVLKGRLKQFLEDNPVTFPMLVMQRMVEAMDRGEIRPVDPFQTLLTIVAACVFFFIGQPMAEILIPSLKADPDAFIEARKQHVFDLIYYGLKPREAEDGPA